jgi:C4-dicarboxylate-specific signal transduction histidine kinase
LNRSATAGQLLASIAHEINQPLAAIAASGNAGLRWLDKEPPNLGEVRATLERIVGAVHRANKVVGTIRAMFKRGTPDKVPLDVNKLLSETLALVQADLQKRHVTLVSDLAAELPEVMADRIQLQQVILNLIMNAIEAMDLVTDRQRVLNVTSGFHNSDDVRITIEDSGPGMNSDEVDRIFEPFYTTKSHGMGLGLSICRSIIETHGGRLSAIQGRPHGLVLRIELPADGAEV